LATDYKFRRKRRLSFNRGVSRGLRGNSIRIET